MDKNTLLKEREEKMKMEEEKRAKKEREKAKKEAEARAKEEAKRMPPAEMFRRETDKYSAFDDKGMPTHDHDGKEISKGQLKVRERAGSGQAGLVVGDGGGGGLRRRVKFGIEGINC